MVTFGSNMGIQSQKWSSQCNLLGKWTLFCSTFASYDFRNVYLQWFNVVDDHIITLLMRLLHQFISNVVESSVRLGLKLKK